jgi:uroporphyrin-III C-methyltransferase/precorrin-2 dehydrogenase/sirohydrochlorin ferrochelatase
VIVDERAEAALAIVAIDLAEEAVARLRARGMLVNAVDRPDLVRFHASGDRRSRSGARRGRHRRGIGRARGSAAPAARSHAAGELGRLARALEAPQDGASRTLARSRRTTALLSAALAPAPLDPLAQRQTGDASRAGSRPRQGAPPTRSVHLLLPRPIPTI